MVRMMWLAAMVGLVACAGSRRPGVTAAGAGGGTSSAVVGGADADGFGLGARAGVDEVPLEVQQMVANLSRVHFETDTSQLTADALAALAENAAILARYPEVRIEVQGHADSRGTTDYNLALGHRRALSVQRALAAHGIAGDRIQPTTFGEEHPIELGATEGAWSANRRAEFRVTWGGDGIVAGSID